MTNDQRTNANGAREGAGDVRAHERAQYATPPTVPTYPAVPTEQNHRSTTDRMAGFADARDETANLLDDRCWIAGYRINWTNSTVTLGSLIKPVTDVLKRKTWATMIRDEGWAFPLRYLAHVEKLLAGADVPVELFNVDGQPTPGQRERERSAERAEARGVLAEIRAAAKASHSDTVAVNAARLEARRAFAEAISRTKTAEADEAAS